MTSVVSRSPEIIESEIDNEVVALNIEEGTCFGMNKVASRIWKILAEPARIADVCGRLVTEYEVDPLTCQRDVLELCEELRTGGLIRFGGGGSLAPHIES